MLMQLRVRASLFQSQSVNPIDLHYAQSQIYNEPNGVDIARYFLYLYSSIYSSCTSRLILSWSRLKLRCPIHSLRREVNRTAARYLRRTHRTCPKNALPIFKFVEKHTFKESFYFRFCLVGIRMINSILDIAFEKLIQEALIVNTIWEKCEWVSH